MKVKVKQNKGISLIVFTIILVVLVFIATGVIVYLLNNPKNESVEKQNSTNIASFNSSSEEFSDNLINSNITNNKIYSDKERKEIEETIENYYKLLTAKENSPVLMLTDVMGLSVQAVQDLQYAPSNYIEHPNSSKYIWTGIKYEDFRNNLWYISDNILKTDFSEFVEYKNYLYVEDNNNNVYNFKYEITKQEINGDSTEHTCICDVTVKNSKTGSMLKNKITMNRGNGDFVIISVSNI